MICHSREKNATYLKDLSVKYDDALTNAGDSEVKYLLQFFLSPLSRACSLSNAVTTRPVGTRLHVLESPISI